MSIMNIPVYYPTSNKEKSSFPHIFLYFLLYLFLIITKLNMVRWNLKVILIYIFLKAQGVVQNRCYEKYLDTTLRN